jgi:DNA-binding NarL/FixJ family response regulator
MGIVAISAGGKKGANYLKAAKTLGADTIISKPLGQEKIISAVEALLH